MTNKSLKNKLPAVNTLEEIQESLQPVISEPSVSTIMFDLDGTLAPIVPRPNQVALPPEISKLIRKLAHIYLAIAIVSGRAATEAMRIVGYSELVYIGNHGFETLLPGRATVVSPEIHPYIDKLLEMKKATVMEEINEAGITLEDKTSTMSYHYRLAENPDEALKYLKNKIVPEAKKLGLKTSEGRMVIEIRPPVAIDKGVSIGRLLDRISSQKAVYMGDDSTDIDALKELRRRRKKGQETIGIGVISKEMPAALPKYSDLLVERRSGVEMVLRILAGEEL